MDFPFPVPVCRALMIITTMMIVSDVNYLFINKSSSIILEKKNIDSSKKFCILQALFILKLDNNLELFCSLIKHHK